MGAGGRCKAHEDSAQRRLEWETAKMSQTVGSLPSVRYRTSPQELAARMDASEVGLQAHRGYIKALEHGPRTLVASHPAHQSLPGAWSMVIAGVADANADRQALAYNTALP